MPRTGHFILHSNVMPKITAGRYERCAPSRPVCPSRWSPRHAHPGGGAALHDADRPDLSTSRRQMRKGAFGDRLPQIVLEAAPAP